MLLRSIYPPYFEMYIYTFLVLDCKKNTPEGEYVNRKILPTIFPELQRSEMLIASCPPRRIKGFSRKAYLPKAGLAPLREEKNISAIHCVGQAALGQKIQQ